MPYGADNTPERKDHDDTYEDIIQKAVAQVDLGLDCKRADDVTRSGSIPADIFRDLHDSRFVIADLTKLNPNVMYELGIRHGLKQGTILMACRGTPLPFDLANERTIFYSKATAREREEAVNKLARYLAEMSGDAKLDDSPVLRAIGETGGAGGSRKSGLEKRLRRKVLAKHISESRFAKRVDNLLAVMEWETLYDLEIPPFFNAFLGRRGGQRDTLYLIMSRYETSTPIGDYLAEYSLEVAELRKTAFDTTKASLERQTNPLAAGYDISSVDKLVFILPYNGMPSDKTALIESLSHHFDRKKCSRNSLVDIFNHLQHFSVESGTVEFQIWDIDTIEQLERENCLINGD